MVMFHKIKWNVKYLKSTGYFFALWISKCVEHKLKDQFIQEWHANMKSSSKGTCYRIFKQNFGLMNINLLSH